MFSKSEWTPPQKKLGGVHLTKILTTQSKSAEFGVVLDQNKHVCNTVKSKHYWVKNMYVFTIVGMQQIFFFRNSELQYVTLKVLQY